MLSIAMFTNSCSLVILLLLGLMLLVLLVIFYRQEKPKEFTLVFIAFISVIVYSITTDFLPVILMTVGLIFTHHSVQPLFYPVAVKNESSDRHIKSYHSQHFFPPYRIYDGGNPKSEEPKFDFYLPNDEVFIIKLPLFLVFKTIKIDFPGTKAISNRELLETECEILIPAAVENVINEENAARVKTEIIVEGANGPVTPSADKILLDKGITIIPDVVANSGGIIVCQFERIQGLTDTYWDIDTVNERLKARILKAYEEMLNTADEMGISLREAAWVNALDKVSAAIRMRGWI